MSFALTAKEVAESLSVGEFTRLCSVVDSQLSRKIKGHTLLGSGWNDNQMNVAERSSITRFDVIAIERNKDCVNVIVDAGKGQVLIPISHKESQRNRTARMNRRVA